MVLINLLNGIENITMNKTMDKNFNIETCKLAIIGLGYVGLPLAIEFGKKRDVIGFDTNQNRINELKNGQDSGCEVSRDDFKQSARLVFTNSIDDIKNCEIFIVAIPTPIDDEKKPDLRLLKKGCDMVGSFIKKGDLIIFESTVYPGVTEEICAHIIEKKSGLIFNKDFFCGYSPERINPGDMDHRITTIVKITSGSTPKISTIVDELYKKIITAGTYKAPSIKVAEAAKVIENTQRDVNIALINELSIIFNKLNIDTKSVLDAAGTKWNFIPFKPGLVGGHCIGVDPYYLAHKSLEIGHNPDMIMTSRNINEKMGFYVVNQVKILMDKKKINIKNANILIMGLTFKENCPDIRNSGAFELVKGFKELNMSVDVFDPWVVKSEAMNEYGIELINEPKQNTYDVIVLAVAHDKFKSFTSEQIISFGKKKNVIYDLKYIFKKEEVDGRL